MMKLILAPNTGLGQGSPQIKTSARMNLSNSPEIPRISVLDISAPRQSLFEQIMARTLIAVFVMGLLASLLRWSALSQAMLLFFGWLLALGSVRRQGLFQNHSRPRSAWTTASVVAIFLAAVLTSLLAGVSYLVVEGTTETSLFTATQQLLLSTITNCLLLLTFPFILRSTAGLTPGDLGLTRWNTCLRDARLGVTFCLVLLPLVFSVFAAAQQIWKKHDHNVETSMRDQGSLEVATLVVLSAVLVAPITEELLFRGVLLGWLETLAASLNVGGRWRQSIFWIPNILVSLFFAAIHYPQWPAPIPLFFLSLGLGFLVKQTGRLGASISAHMFFNAISTVILLGETFNGRLGPELEKIPQPTAATQPAASTSPP